jgi:membrane protease YdiL (CAAX protease family)
MGLESLLLSIPLFVLMLVGWGALRQMGLQGPDAAGGGTLDWPAQMVYSVGAGIYEELLFRLIAIALIHMFLVDALALPQQTGAFGAIAVSATFFALYHFSPRNPFDFTRFVFYSAAGVYFAAIYLLRGFGIVAGTHAMYDILVVVLQMVQQSQQPT